MYYLTKIVATGHRPAIKLWQLPLIFQVGHLKPLPNSVQKHRQLKQLNLATYHLLTEESLLRQYFRSQSRRREKAAVLKLCVSNCEGEPLLHYHPEVAIFYKYRCR